jgi:hypothetical protein
LPGVTHHQKYSNRLFRGQNIFMRSNRQLTYMLCPVSESARYSILAYRCIVAVSEELSRDTENIIEKGLITYY